MEETDTLNLPRALIALQDRFPWESIAVAARRELIEVTPELSEAVLDLDTRVFGLQSGFFYLPAAQLIAWGQDDSASIHDLLVLLAIGHAHFAIQDLTVDSGRCPPELCLLSDVLLLEYLNRLESFAQPTTGYYRQMHSGYYRWYLRALSTDLRHRRSLHQYTSPEVRELGLKAAPGNTILHLVAHLAGRPDSVDSLVRAVMQLCTGLQLLDDLNDIEGDYGDGNLTVPVTSTLLSLAGSAEDQSIEASDLHAAAALAGVSTACIEMAREFFDLASASAAAADAGVVQALALTWSRRCAYRQQQFEHLLSE